MSNSKFTPLEPRYFLDEEWKYHEKVPGLPDGISSSAKIHLSREYWTDPAFAKRREEQRPGYKKKLKKWVNWIKSIRIEIAEESQTEKIKSDKDYDYLRSEIGMNIIVPRGRIAEMRFRVSLLAKHRVVAMDGFPKDVINQRHIVEGTIRVAINEYFKFIPGIPPGILDSIKIELGPWDFNLGSLRRVNIDFSGGLTSTPEWYFKRDGIKNDLRVAITIRKPKKVKKIEGKVIVAWVYVPGFLKRARVRSSAKSIKIL
ncbi:MAG: hypothetical protein KAT69_09450 [Candidatus Aminicenantes bacterium]|nr:hypothetical protein [Candidatus Aminicenantes bacterium]